MSIDKEPDYKSEKWLKNEYLLQKKTKKQIASEQCVPRSTIDYWCRKFQLRKPSVNKPKRKRLIKQAIITRFISKYCTKHKGLAVDQTAFLEALRNYNNQILFTQMYVTKFLKKQGALSKISRNKYLNIYFNSRGLKRFFPNKVREIAIQEIREGGVQEISHTEACKLVSCQPTVELLKTLIKESNLSIDIDKTIKKIQLIEKLAYKKGITPDIKTKIALALYTGRYMSAEKLTSFLGISMTGISHLKKQINSELYSSTIQFL